MGSSASRRFYMLINGEVPPYYTLPEIINDTRGLHVNVETLELSYYMKTRMENNPSWQNITDVFKGKVSAFDLQALYASAGRSLGMDELKKLNDNIAAITRIRDRDFPEQTIPVKANIREAIDIFYKVNASGVALTDAELALAQISGYWPQARDLFKAKLTELEKNGFVLKLDFVVYVLLGCLHHMGSDMRKLHDASNNDKAARGMGSAGQAGARLRSEPDAHQRLCGPHGGDQLAIRARSDHRVLLRQERQAPDRYGDPEAGEVVLLFADPLSGTSVSCRRNWTRTCAPWRNPRTPSMPCCRTSPRSVS
jgi:hypothetical protein